MLDVARSPPAAGRRVRANILPRVHLIDASKILLAVMSAILLAGADAVQAQTFQTLPAPPGDAADVALRVIRKAEHPCPRLARASRLSDETIVAVCTNRESYRVFSIRNKAGRVMDLSMRCSAAKKLGIAGAC